VSEWKEFKDGRENERLEKAANYCPIPLSAAKKTETQKWERKNFRGEKPEREGRINFTREKRF